MDYKNDIKKKFADFQTITLYRYESSKNIFVYLTLAFFMNYFFVWAKFFDNVFIITLPYVYFWFLISFCFFVYFYFKTNFDIKKTYELLLSIFLILAFLIFTIPFLWY